jgi:hypothetical protein
MASPPLSIINHSQDCLTSERARTNRNLHLPSELAEITPKLAASDKIDTKGCLVGKADKIRHVSSLSLHMKPDGSHVQAKLVVDCQNSGLQLSTKRQRRDASGNGLVDHDEEIPLSSRGDISLLSVSLRSNQTKQFRRTIASLWSIKDYNDINIHFEPPGTILSLPESSPMIKKGQQPPNPINGSNEKLHLSKANTGYDERNQDTSAASKGEIYDGFKPSLLGNNLQRILESGYASEVNMIPKSLLKVIPLRFLKSFREDGRRCTAWTLEGQRCKRAHSIGLLSSQLEVLASFKLSALYQSIEELIEVFLCSSHRKIARKQIQPWKDEFGKLVLIQAERSAPSPQNERLCSLFRWIRFLCQAALFHTSLTPSSVPSPEDLIHGVEKSSPNPIQFFKPHPSSGLKEPLSERLTRLITKPLQTGDIRYRGSIYIFWHPGNFGKLKIGRSANVRQRLKEWNKQCKRVLGVHYPDLSKNGLESTSDTQQVPHISRVEALVHLELMHFRKIEPKCAGCSKSHVEWFEVPKDIAISVVRKWTSWMSTLPYERRVAGSQEQWVLKSEELSQVDRLCQLQQSLSSPSVPTNKQDWISSRLRSSVRKTN